VAGVSQPIFIVDAFAEAPFTGNPAAVVPLIEKRSDSWMQSVASEMNLSETAFVDMYSDAEVKSLRWFTPTAEVNLCGHATLAAAHVLGGSQRFDTLSGELQCVRDASGMIEMNFPADPSTEVRNVDWSSAFPGANIVSTWRGVSDYLVEVSSTKDLLQIQPVFSAISELGVRGVIVTAPSDLEGVDFVSRCFYPAVGVPEDPVTGSAHTTLTSFWSPRLEREQLIGVQLSQRTGTVRVRLDGDRVHMAGRAVTVLKGELTAK
jgi:predicted PhzF superfamily epimerase YddE/YHI9